MLVCNKRLDEESKVKNECDIEGWKESCKRSVSYLPVNIRAPQRNISERRFWDLEGVVEDTNSVFPSGSL